jgi:hypothetical protein
MYGIPHGITVAPTAAPTGPSQFFQEFEEAMAPARDAEKRAAEDRYAATVSATQQAIQQTQAQQNPMSVPVPEGADPLLASLAGFFAHLNSSQTGSGAAVAGLQNTLGQIAGARENAINQNADLSNRFALSKFSTTEALHRDLLTAMRDKAAEAGDIEKTFQHNKALYALERQKKKEDLAALKEIQTVKGANAKDLIKYRSDLSMDRIRLANRLRRDAESRAMTPAQRAEMALANAQVAELRASLDDYRGARDIAGEPIHDEEDIQAQEDLVAGQIEDIYKRTIAKFEGAGKNAEPVKPPPVNATPSGTVSDRVKSAAERLRGSGLFTQ